AKAQHLMHRHPCGAQHHRDIEGNIFQNAQGQISFKLMKVTARPHWRRVVAATRQNSTITVSE
ncbi:MAG TPA: hypothetical protein VNO18_04315, partial [Xanthobacteraceae bacterium]|nr:hypothetical protein [Xanthobacteraceae bacterium]